MSSCTYSIKAFPVTYFWYSHPRSDKLRWMYALTPNRRTRFMSTSSHQTGEAQFHVMLWLSVSLWMEMWIWTSTLWYISDSPQVQCIQSYSSQEPDELSIEMADVLNLLERTDDGLYSASMITMKTIWIFKYIFRSSFSTFCLSASFVLQAGWWERDSMMVKGAGSPVDLWKRSRARRFVLRTWEKLSGFSRPKREE